MTWWESWFGEEYLDLYPHRDLDVGPARGGFRAGAPAPGTRAPCSTSAAAPAGTRSPSPKPGSRRSASTTRRPSWTWRGGATATSSSCAATCARSPSRTAPSRRSSTSSRASATSCARPRIVSVVSEIERVLRRGGAFLCDTFSRDYVLATPRSGGAPELRREAIHDPPLLERREPPASRRRSRSAAKARSRSSARACARTAADELGGAFLRRGAHDRGDVGRLRRVPGRPRFAAPDRPRAQAREARVIPFEKYPGLSPLFLDFLRGLPEFFPDPPTLDAAAARGRELLAAGARARVPASAFRHRGGEAARLAEDLVAGRAVAVSAGHQVGIFTGPIFTLMKALDAIHIARELTKRGVPAVPVFWALTDDHDLQEIARTARPAPEGPEELVLEGADRQNRQPVGRLPIPDGIRGDRRGLPLRARARGRRPGARGVRAAQRARHALRRGVHRDAARSRGPRPAPRPRAARRRRRVRRRSSSFSRRPRKSARPRGDAARDRKRRSAARASRSRRPLPEGFSFFLDRRGGAAARRRTCPRPSPGSGRATASRRPTS